MSFTITASATDLDLDVTKARFRVYSLLSYTVEDGTLRLPHADGEFVSGDLVNAESGGAWVIGAPEGTPLTLRVVNSRLPAIPMFNAPADGTTVDLVTLYEQNVSPVPGEPLTPTEYQILSTALAGKEPLIQDTGWRIVSEWGTDGVVTGDPLPSGCAPEPSRAGFVRWRRVGDRVTFSVLNIVHTTALAFFTSPGAGFERLAPPLAWPAYDGTGQFYSYPGPDGPVHAVTVPRNPGFAYEWTFDVYDVPFPDPADWPGWAQT